MRGQISSQEREQAIRLSAYHRWEQAGRPDGRDVELWQQAERDFDEQPPDAQRRIVQVNRDQERINEDRTVGSRHQALTA